MEQERNHRFYRLDMLPERLERVYLTLGTIESRARDLALNRVIFDFGESAPETASDVIDEVLRFEVPDICELAEMACKKLIAWQLDIKAMCLEIDALQTELNRIKKASGQRK